MSVRTIGQKIGQWLSNIKLLIALLPLIGFSIGFTQHDTIKTVVKEEPAKKFEAVEIVNPITPNYDLVIDRLMDEDKAIKNKIGNQAKDIENLKKWHE